MEDAIDTGDDDGQVSRSNSGCNSVSVNTCVEENRQASVEPPLVHKRTTFFIDYVYVDDFSDFLNLTSIRNCSVSGWSWEFC